MPSPFTELYTQAQAQYVKEHPEAAKEPVLPLVQVILDQEAAAAKDFAAGKLSAEEYEGFVAKCESQVDAFKAEIKEAGLEIVENFKDWAHDARDEFDVLKDDHPELIQNAENGHLTVAQAADAGEFAINVVEPLAHTAFDSVVVLTDHITEGLGAAAANIVEARNELSSVDQVEREANLAQLDKALEACAVDVETIHETFDALHDKIDAEISQARDAIEAAHDYGEAHPDAEIFSGQIIGAPDAEQEALDDAGVVDA